MPWLFGSDWAAGPEPFPRPLRWALVAAPLCLLAAWMVPYSTRDAVRIVQIVLFAVSALCALLAVPTAALQLAFRPQYRNHDNLVMTLIAAIPFVVAAFALILYSAVTITGGSLH